MVKDVVLALHILAKQLCAENLVRDTFLSWATRDVCSIDPPWGPLMVRRSHIRKRVPSAYYVLSIIEVRSLHCVRKDKKRYKILNKFILNCAELYPPPILWKH